MDLLKKKMNRVDTLVVDVVDVVLPKTKKSSVNSIFSVVLSLNFNYLLWVHNMYKHEVIFTPEHDSIRATSSNCVHSPCTLVRSIK